MFIFQSLTGRCSAAWAVLGGLLLWALPTLPASAFHPRVGNYVQTANGKDWGIVTVNDADVIAFHNGEGGFSPAERAAIAARRLNDAATVGLTGAQIEFVAVTPDSWAIKAQGNVVLIVSTEEAQTHGLPVAALAEAWTNALRRAVNQPALAVGTARLIVPLGETRTIAVGGAARPQDIAIQDSDHAVTRSAYNVQQRLLVIRGLAPGNATVGVRAGVDSASVAVAVMPYAAHVAPQITVRVTGTPSAPADLISQATYLGLMQAVEPEAGAQIKILQAPRLAASLRDGEQTIAGIPIRLFGPNMLSVEARPQIRIVNNSLPPRSAESLLYSNNPEQVKRSQTLFVGHLPPFRSVRLDFHHQNMSGGPLNFHIDLLNGSDQRAAVHLMVGVSQPGLDTVQVGRRAGAGFLKALNSQAGIVIDVPPHSSVPIITQRLPSELTISGLVQMQQINGPREGLRLRVSADGSESEVSTSLPRLLLAAQTSEALPAPDAERPLPPSGGDGAVSPFAFGSPRISVARRYSVGGPWAHVRIGDGDALNNSAGTRKLFGNYGVTYEVAFAVSNPMPDARQVALLFVPEAGLAAGVFQVDGGPILEYDPLAPPEERELGRYSLAPGETRLIHVTTLSLNGSFYPASLVVHALEKRSAPAPIAPPPVVPPPLPPVVLPGNPPPTNTGTRPPATPATKG